MVVCRAADTAERKAVVARLHLEMGEDACNVVQDALELEVGFDIAREAGLGAGRARVAAEAQPLEAGREALPAEDVLAAAQRHGIGEQLRAEGARELKAELEKASYDSVVAGDDRRRRRQREAAHVIQHVRHELKRVATAIGRPATSKKSERGFWRQNLTKRHENAERYDSGVVRQVDSIHSTAQRAVAV